MTEIANILPESNLNPGTVVQYDDSNAVTTLPGMPRMVVLMGQFDPAASMAANSLMLAYNAPQVEALVGRNSMLAGMYDKAAANNGGSLPIYLLGVADNAAGNAASGKFTVSGSPTQSGTLNLYVAGQRFTVGAQLGATASNIASDIATVLNASRYVTASANAGDVTLTCRWKGETGNDITLRLNHNDREFTPPGLTIGINIMAGGTGNPDISPALTAAPGKQLTEVVMPYSDSANLQALEAWLSSQRDLPGSFDAHAITAIRGTVGQTLNWADSRNHEMAHTIDAVGPSPSWEHAAATGAVVENHVAGYKGGDPAVPFTGLDLNGLVSPANVEQRSSDENNLLLNAGISTVRSKPDGSLEVSRMVTNRTKNDAGIATPAYRNLNRVKILQHRKWMFIFFSQQKLQGFKLAEFLPEPIPGQKILDEQGGREFAAFVEGISQDNGLTQDMPGYMQKLLVQIDVLNGRLKVIEAPYLMGQHYQNEITIAFIAG